MFRSKQQNQPNREASTTSESASPRAFAPQRGSRSAAPPPAPAGGRWEGSLRFLPSLPSGPLRAVWAQWPAAAGLSRKSGQRDLALVADCARGGAAGLGGRGGGSFPSQGFSCAQSPRVSHAVPQLPLWPRASTRVLQTSGGVCSPRRLSDQQPRGPPPTPRAEVFPELWGTQAPSLHVRGLPVPGQGPLPAPKRVGGLALTRRSWFPVWRRPRAWSGGGKARLASQGLITGSKPRAPALQCLVPRGSRGTGQAGAWLRGEVGVTVLWVWTAGAERARRGGRPGPSTAPSPALGSGPGWEGQQTRQQGGAPGQAGEAAKKITKD